MVVVILLFRLYVGMKFALWIAIDDDIPHYKYDWEILRADFIYRTLRVLWCISVIFFMYWWIIYSIGFYILAWIFKKIVVYFYYYY